MPQEFLLVTLMVFYTKLSSHLTGWHMIYGTFYPFTCIIWLPHPTTPIPTPPAHLSVWSEFQPFCLCLAPPESNFLACHCFALRWTLDTKDILFQKWRFAPSNSSPFCSAWSPPRVGGHASKPASEHRGLQLRHLLGCEGFHYSSKSSSALLLARPWTKVLINGVCRWRDAYVPKIVNLLNLHV